MADNDMDDNARKSPGFAEFTAGGVAAAAGLGIAGSIYSKKFNIKPDNIAESEGKIKEILGSLRKPADEVVAVFRKGDTKTNVKMGAIAAVSSIVAGYAMNKFRNRTPESLPDSFAASEDSRRAADAGASKAVG